MTIKKWEDMNMKIFVMLCANIFLFVVRICFLGVQGFVTILWNITLDVIRIAGNFIAYAITGVILPLAYIFLFIGGDISRGWFMTILSLVVIYCIAYGVSYAKHGTIIEFWRGPKFLKMW